MKYLGSKNRISKDILDIILENWNSRTTYVEVFVGGANMIDKVGGKRIGADNNKYVIALLKKLRDGWLPPKKITKEEYLAMKENPDDYPDHLIGYVATQLSYGAMWFGSYRRDNTGKRDYSLEAYNNVKKQAPNLKGIEFIHADYRDVEIPDRSIIYCDPPYKDTIKYKKAGEFNHDEFWEWVREKSREGHSVYVSEYNAPLDFAIRWERK